MMAYWVSGGVTPRILDLGTCIYKSKTQN